MSSNFAIVNMRGGQQQNVDPILLDNDSFPLLKNIFLFRGRIRRKSGCSYVGSDGRLKITFEGMANGSGVFNKTLEESDLGFSVAEGVAQFFVEGIVSAASAEATLTDPGGQSPAVTLLTTNPAITGSLNLTTGVLSVFGLDAASAVTVVYYPCLPVMGLRTFEVQDPNVINNEGLLAFDTRYTYKFDSATNGFIIQNAQSGALAPPAYNFIIWSGDNSQLFWSCNFQKAFWATNSVPGKHASETTTMASEGDGIRWYDSTTGFWYNFNPPIDSTEFLLGSLAIVPYKDRLVAFNTNEGTAIGSVANEHPQRIRWSQDGTVFYGEKPASETAQADSWRSDINGKGGFLDLPTSESIISVEFIKDTLIVYCERSSWNLTFIGSPEVFQAQKINTELGTESTFSIVPFDAGVLGVGNYGIISCDSVGVRRIDEKIPDEAFRIQNANEGVKRVFGIRDYSAEMAYFTYPVKTDFTGTSVPYTLTFPNQVLFFNYLDGSWSQTDDHFTCFGYWQDFQDKTWEDVGDLTWEEANFTWESGITQSRYPAVAAGNQRGFVFVFSQLENRTANVSSLIINNFSIVSGVSATVTCPDHNFSVGDFVLVNGMNGVSSSLNNVIYKVSNPLDEDTFRILTYDASTGIFIPPEGSGVYTGGGTISHVQNVFIRTKEFNPAFQNAIAIRINYIDVLVQRTDSGALTVQFFLDSNTSDSVQDVNLNTFPESVTYTVPDPSYQSRQDKIFNRIFVNAKGGFIQNVITMSDVQMIDPLIVNSNVVIHSLIYNVQPSGRISHDL